MDGLVGILAFLAFAGVLSALLLFAGRQQRRATQREALEAPRREAAARQRGWAYDGTREGDIAYRISGRTPGGHAWRLWYDTDAGSSSSSPKLVWRAASVASPRVEWHVVDRIGRKVFTGGAGLLKAGTRFFARFNDTARLYAEFLQDAQLVPLESAGEAGRYAVLCREPGAERIFDAEALRLLHDWPPFKPSYSAKDNCISISRDTEGVSLTCACDAPSIEVIEHAVALGSRVADRAQGHGRLT
jgi:hypothetical protein